MSQERICHPCIATLEVIRAREDLYSNYDKSTPYRSESNGIAENVVRRVKERTCILLVQSGLSEKWWREAMETSKNKLTDRKSPCERRCGTPFDGPHGTASRMDGQ